MLTLLAMAGVGFAQQSEGVITYEIKTNLHRNIPEDRQQMRRMLPEFRTQTTQLFFNADESFFKAVGEPDAAGPQNGMRMRSGNPKNEIYTHHADYRQVILREFLGKRYLIEDTLRIPAWKIHSETRDVNGYTCRKATLVDEEGKRNIVAWYAEELRPFLGPEEFNTLPGAVIFVDINDGERTITAKQILLRPLAQGEIKIPEGRNKITGDEYRTIVKQQTERMRANNRGQGGQFRMRTQP